MLDQNVEQAVYSCNDEDIVVNLIMRFFFICRILFGIDAGTRDYVGISLANAVQQNGQWLSDVRWKRGKIVTENVKNLCEEILFETQNPSSLIRKSMLLIFYGNVLRLHEKELIVLGREGRAGGYQLADMLFYMEIILHVACQSWQVHLT